MGDKSPPGTERGLSRAVSRLLGIYWISSVTKCEMNHVVNQPEGPERELELSIKAWPSIASFRKPLESTAADECDISEQRPARTEELTADSQLSLIFFFSLSLSFSLNERFHFPKIFFLISQFIFEVFLFNNYGYIIYAI